MKKTFQFKVENKNPHRQADSIKHEVKKYLTRERKKKLPDGCDVWDFDCRIGVNETESESILVTQINSHISKLCTDEEDSFYLEILARASKKVKKEN